jgi:hypothetical protein
MKTPYPYWAIGSAEAVPDGRALTPVPGLKIATDARPITRAVVISSFKIE